MKKVLLIIISLLTLFILVGCSENRVETVKISVEYEALEGGKIDGAKMQEKEVEKGEFAHFNGVYAVADNEYRFVEWSDGKTDRFRADSLDESKKFTAIFEKIPYSVVTYATNGGGIIDGENTQRLENGYYTTKVTAIANENYYFVSWSDGVTEATRQDIVDTDKTITAIFSDKYKIKYEALEGGYIFGTTEQSISYGQSSQTVRAIANKGYEFIGWSDGNTKISRTDIVTGDTVVCAYFRKYHTIEFGCDSLYGKLEGTLKQKVFDGEITTSVTAIPDEGYSFMCWSNGETSSTIQVTATESTYIHAYFSLKSTGLSVISIETELDEKGNNKEITSRTEYVGCVITVFDPFTGYNVINETAQIRGRGNSTWTQPAFYKKPYKIKFDFKQNLFGYGEAKDWVLMADYSDKSLLRNFMAYSLAGTFTALGASPDCQIVEVYLNGMYHGTYLLCEQIEINENRVEIGEDSSVIDTGYLVEMDGWAGSNNEDDPYVSVPDSLNGNRRYTIKGPDSDELTDAHKDYIAGYLKGCLEIIAGNDYEEIKRLVDVESFAQAYIVHELFKCPDVDYSSFYLYKKEGGKLYCGPVWDFDMACGNAGHKNGNSYKYNYLWARYHNPWYKGLLEHSEFVALVAKTLNEYKPQIEECLESYFDWAYENSESLKKNFEKWDILGIYVWPNPSALTNLKTWEEHVEYVRTFLKNSMSFMVSNYPYSENQT